MTVSMRKLSPGAGYRYLLKSVAAGDGNRSLSSPLTRYYAEAGTPPGYWLGSGLSALGGGRIKAGGQVGEAQLALLIGSGRDPVTGDQLGRAFPESRSLKDRVTARVADLPHDLEGVERDAAVDRITAEEVESGSRRPVAGFDFTFSVSKSVSVLWAVADADTQAMIVEAHHAAVAEVIDYFEREVAATRTGVSNGNGAVAQVAVEGVAAAAFDHYDSRAGDPQLHTHVVVSNKVRTVLDGRWRSLDSRPVHASVTALSAHYNAVLADRLSGTFGVVWEPRERGRDRNVQWEIAGVSEDLIREFSSRTREIELEKERLIEGYVERHGCLPSHQTILHLRAQATLATRPEKQVRSLADLTDDWRRRAGSVLGEDATSWSRRIITTDNPARETVGTPVFDGSVLDEERVRGVATEVVAEVSTQRATWRHWNLWAAASRATMGWRFPTAVDRETVIDAIVQAAVAQSVCLTPPELAPTPADFQRADGTSVFRPRHGAVYSSLDVLAAEDRLLEHLNSHGAPAVEVREVDEQLSASQRAAVAAITASGRGLDLLVGPAGAGKTTTMAALRHVWESSWGSGSVVGLAPSAAAAKVLAGDLGIRCENTAKWLHEHDRCNTTFKPGQLVIIDEASLASTATLDRITGLVKAAGAKVLLVGDDAQLQSVDAGGAFGMLVNAHPEPPTLTEIHRFTEPWEADSASALRTGDPVAVATYSRHGRLRDGTTAEMLDAAYAGWHHDLHAGFETLLVADTRRTVDALNQRARAERILAGEVDDTTEVHLADDARCSAGDWIITRANDRTLKATANRWVRNGDRWTVAATNADGSIRARGPDGIEEVLLPPGYVTSSVELGYAVTAHRAQGATVDTCHAITSASTTRENLYVAMSRGRHSNIAYVALDKPDDNHATADPDTTAAQVLHGILRHPGAELSARETIATERHAATSIAQLAAEYETLAAAAQRPRWIALVRDSGLDPAQCDAVIASPSCGALFAALRRIEAHGHDPAIALRTVVARRRLDDADDIAAVLHARLESSPRSGLQSGRPDLIGGLIPAARGPMPSDYAAALRKREQLIEQRAHELGTIAIQRRVPWLRRLGERPHERSAADLWDSAVTATATYVDRFGVEPRSSLTATNLAGPRVTGSQVTSRAVSTPTSASETLSRDTF